MRRFAEAKQSPHVSIIFIINRTALKGNNCATSHELFDYFSETESHIMHVHGHETLIHMYQIWEWSEANTAKEDVLPCRPNGCPKQELLNGVRHTGARRQVLVAKNNAFWWSLSVIFHDQWKPDFFLDIFSSCLFSTLLVFSLQLVIPLCVSFVTTNTQAKIASLAEKENITKSDTKRLVGKNCLLIRNRHALN